GETRFDTEEMKRILSHRATCCVQGRKAIAPERKELAIAPGAIPSFLWLFPKAIEMPFCVVPETTLPTPLMVPPNMLPLLAKLTRLANPIIPGARMVSGDFFVSPALKGYLLPTS